jgi:NADH-quinone oxidoreductase subunit L
MGTLTLIVLLPLLGFLANGLLGNALGKRFVSVVGCGLPLASFALAGAALRALEAGGAPIVEVAYTWALIGDTAFEIAFYFDRLAAVMTPRRHRCGLGDPYLFDRLHARRQSYARFFAYLNLFLFFMLLLVLGRSMLVLFVGWEGVGLASYC